MEMRVLMNHPWVTIAAGERFHSFELARHVNRASRLGRYIGVYPQRKLAPLWSGAFYTPDVRACTIKKVLDRVHVPARWLDTLFAHYAARHIGNVTALHIWSGYALPAMQRAHARGIPVVLEHGSTHPAHQMCIVRTPGNAALRQLEEFDQADAIIVPSWWVHSTMRRHGVAADKLHVIPYGVDVDRFTPFRFPVELRSDRRLRVLYVGSLSPRKGLKYLYDAIDHDTMQIRVVGGTRGEHVPEGVQHYPHTHRPETHYHWADVLVHPSLEEGMALTTLEALACDVPVICTNETGTGEIMDGCGIVIQSRSSTDISEALDHVRRDPPTGMRACAEQYTWQRYANAVMAIYDHLYRSN